MNKSGLGVGWVIVGLLAVVAVVLAVNGTLGSKFHGLWTWIATIGQGNANAGSSNGGNQTTVSRIMNNPTLGPWWSPAINPIAMWKQIITGLGKL